MQKRQNQGVLCKIPGVLLEKGWSEVSWTEFTMDRESGQRFRVARLGYAHAKWRSRRDGTAWAMAQGDGGAGA